MNRPYGFNANVNKVLIYVSYSTPRVRGLSENGD